MSRTRTSATFAPPVMAAGRWLEGVDFSEEQPLINVCQAAPMAPPPEALRAVMADAALHDISAHLYGPDLGRPDLREALACTTGRIYTGSVSGEQIAITSGCNQAFAAAIHALTGEGDSVLLPVPWYFNHKMWLDMAGVEAVPVPTGRDMLPDPDDVARRITPSCRALAVVTPNNPAGVEYPPALIRALFELCRDRGIKLILDETYRDFHGADGAPHDLFCDPDWPDTLIHLYSFSKAFRLTGHRLGAMAADIRLMPEVEKFIDTVTICPNQIAQIAGLWGLRNLDQWLSAERQEILGRRMAISDGFGPLRDRGWSLAGLGGFFAYLRHPFDLSSDRLAPLLVREAGVLLLPGTMFRPDDDPAAAAELRIAFANLDRTGIGHLIGRLSALAL